MWTIVQVCLVHKKQDKFNLANDQPINPLSIICNVMEDVVNNVIKWHLLTNNLMTDG